MSWQDSVPEWGLDIAATVILAICGIACLVLAGASCLCVRQRKEPSRRGFFWFRLAITAFTIYLVAKITQSILLSVWDRRYQSWDDHIQITYSFLVITTFLGTVADVLLFLTLFELALGLLRTNFPKAERKIKFYKITHQVLLGILLVLALPELGLQFKQIWEQDASYYDTSLFGLRIGAAINIIYWALMLELLALSVLLLARAFKAKEHKQIALYIFIAVLTNFVRATYVFILTVGYSLGSNYLARGIIIVDPLFYTFLYDICALVVLILGYRKNWSLATHPWPVAPLAPASQHLQPQYQPYHHYQAQYPQQYQNAPPYQQPVYYSQPVYPPPEAHQLAANSVVHEMPPPN